MVFIYRVLLCLEFVTMFGVKALKTSGGMKWWLIRTSLAEKCCCVSWSSAPVTTDYTVPSILSLFQEVKLPIQAYWTWTWEGPTNRSATTLVLLQVLHRQALNNGPPKIKVGHLLFGHLTVEDEAVHYRYFQQVEEQLSPPLTSFSHKRIWHR